MFKYKFLFKHYDVERIMNSGLVTGFHYDGDYMHITTSECCDHWFA